MKLSKLIQGKSSFQKIFNQLFMFALKGLNYGNGAHFNESGELNALKIVKINLKSEKLTVFDVGANVGNYAKALFDVFGKNVTIHSFEPSKATYQKFVENTQGISQIIANNFGISDIEQNLTLYTDTDHSGLASVYHRNLDFVGKTMDKTEEIELTTLDVYCKKNNIEKIHFLKLDIEGHELNALNGAKEMLNNKKIDFIQFEFGGCNIDSKTYFKDYFYLLHNDFKIYRILKDGLFEIKNYGEKYEIFITINYLAVNKNIQL